MHSSHLWFLRLLLRLEVWSLLSNHDRECDVVFDWRSHRCAVKISQAAVQNSVQFDDFTSDDASE